MTLTQLVTDYLAELQDGGVDDPLGTQLTVAAVLADLLTLAGEPLPAEIAARLEEPAALTAA